MEVILQSLLCKLNIAKNDQLLSNSFHFSLQVQNDHMASLMQFYRGISVNNICLISIGASVSLITLQNISLNRYGIENLDLQNYNFQKQSRSIKLVHIIHE